MGRLASTEPSDLKPSLPAMFGRILGTNRGTDAGGGSGRRSGLPSLPHDAAGLDLHRSIMSYTSGSREKGAGGKPR